MTALIEPEKKIVHAFFDCQNLFLSVKQLWPEHKTPDFDPVALARAVVKNQDRWSLKGIHLYTGIHEPYLALEVLPPLIDTVRIGPIDYEVRENPELGLDGDVAGRVSIGVSRIEVDPHMEPQRRAFVLLHEVVHAILIHGQVDLGEDEESVVDVMALGFLAFLRDNPGLVAKIQAMWHG